MMKVVRTFSFDYASEIEQAIFDDKIDVKVIPSPSEDEIIENSKEADAIICAYEPITKRVMDALPRLKLIACGTIGYNYVDIDYASEKGIYVTNISQYCVKEVADYTIAMILMLNRRIMQFHNSVKDKKKWQYNLFPDIKRLEEQTVGLLGFGNIPRLVAEKLKPFGPKIIAFDPFVNKDDAKKEYNVDVLSFNELLNQSDIISIHLPVNEETYKIINDRNIEQMKDGVIVINSARGQLVDEKSVDAAVEVGKIKYYATDVLDEETPDLNKHPFIHQENIIITPHIAFYSQESMKEGITEWSLNVKNFFEGKYEKCSFIR